MSRSRRGEADTNTSCSCVTVYNLQMKDTLEPEAKYHCDV